MGSRVVLERPPGNVDSRAVLERPPEETPSRWLDYGRARAKYIDAFFNNLDWGVVAANLDRALSMQPATK